MKGIRQKTEYFETIFENHLNAGGLCVVRGCMGRGMSMYVPDNRLIKTGTILIYMHICMEERYLREM